VQQGSRDNVNPNESTLKATSLSLTATNSPDLSGIVYAEPLYVSQVSVSVGGQAKTVNALFVATEENYVYALDADNISNPTPLWSKNLNNTGETAVPDSVLPRTCNNIAPEVGITGTPVIDTGYNIMYVVSKHVNGTTYTQRLNVLKLYDGSLAVSPSVDIGNVLGSSFSALNQNQRAGLALVSQGAIPLGGGPNVFVTWASHCDGGAYNGWVAAFHYTPVPTPTLQFVSSFNDEGTGGSDGGIWMSGAAPAASEAATSQNHADVYLATGNGSVNYTSGRYGQSVLRLDDSSGSIGVTGSYTPSVWNILNTGSFTMGNCTSPLNLPPPYTSGSTVCVQNDMDLGAGGVMLVRPVGSGYLPPNDSFVVLAAGKEGVFYVLDPSNMSNTGPDTNDCHTGSTSQALQCFGAITIPTGNLSSDAYGNRGSAAFWAGNSSNSENVLYVAGSQDTKIRAYQMTANGGGVFTTGPTIFGSAPTPNPNGSNVAPYPGSSPVISWNTNGGSTRDAILWILDTSGYSSGPAKLYAYQAVPPQAGGSFTLEWSDTTNGPLPTKFIVPTVINGYVYVGGQKPGATCSAGSCAGRVVAWH
jgi:hypothetical protein